MVKGQEVARKVGNAQATNVVMVGAFSNFFPEIKEASWLKAVKALLPPKIHEVNVKAFYEGRNAF